ncbi:MAG: acyl-homoserine-lactone synthase [Rhizobiaceae bacterium]
MFLILEDSKKHGNRALVERMFNLRAEVFHDKLGWDVEVGKHGEVDVYDDANPAYLMWCNAEQTTLYGCLRLLPTTGPTLLYDVFRETFPNNVSLTAPGIWEGTRLCIDEVAIARDIPDLDAKQAFCLMLLALCETALKFNIHTLISNYEPATKRLYNMAGAPLTELGRADGFGKRPVCAGSFEVSEKVLSNMRTRLGIVGSLFTTELDQLIKDSEQKQRAEAA